MLPTSQLAETIQRERKAVLVVNTQSRRGRRLFARSVRALAESGVSLVDAYAIRDPARLPQTVRECVDRCRLVIVGGGDGTISSIVNHFAYRDAVLGVLPLGTGNSFARTLGIPQSVAGAVDVIVNGRVADIDLGKINDRYFTNVTSIGFSGDVGKATSQKLKRRFGRLAYVIAGLPIWLGHRAFWCRMDSAEGQVEAYTHELIIANGRFHGGALLAPNAKVDNCRLSVFTMGGASRWEMLRVWFAAFRGRRVDLPQSHYIVTQDIRVVARPPQHVDMDGEITSCTPVRATVAVKALRVMAPAGLEERAA